MAKKWESLKQRMRPEARREIEAAARAERAAMPLADIRKAVGLTQNEIARQLEVGQGTVSNIENSADMYLTTLRKYIEALGGELELMASFPGGRKMIIVSLAALAERPPARVER